MAYSSSERNSSVAADFTFAKHPEGYSFTEAISGRLPIDPTFHTDPTSVIVQQGNHYVYPREKEKRCRDLRSQAISCIVYGFLMLGCNVGYLMAHGLKNSAYLSLAVDLTKCAGIWGGSFAILGGILALMTATRAERISPMSSIGVFTGLAAFQLVALGVAVAAAVLSCYAMQVSWMIPTINAGFWLFSNSSMIFGEPTYWLALFNWIFAFGPVGSFIFTLKHAMIIAVDVVSLK